MRAPTRIKVTASEFGCEREMNRQPNGILVLILAVAAAFQVFHAQLDLRK